MDYSTIWMDGCVQFVFFLRASGGARKVECVKKCALVDCPTIWMCIWGSFFSHLFFFLKVNGPQEAECVWMDCSTIWVGVWGKKIFFLKGGGFKRVGMCINELSNYSSGCIGKVFFSWGQEGSKRGEKQWVLMNYQTISWVHGNFFFFLKVNGGHKRGEMCLKCMYYSIV